MNATGYVLIDTKEQVIFWSPTIEEWSGIPASQAVGQKIAHLLPLLEQSGLMFLLRQTIQHGQFFSVSHTFGKEIVQPQKGLEFPQNIYFSPFFSGNEIQGAEIIIQNAQERILIERELIRQVRYLEALHKIDHLVAQGAYTQALQSIVLQIGMMLDANLALIFSRSSQDSWKLEEAWNPHEVSLQIEEAPQKTLLGQALEAPQETLVPSSSQEAPAKALLAPGSRAAAALPLGNNDQVLGLLYLEVPSPDRLQGDHITLLHNLAATASISLKNRAAREHEIRRLQELELNTRLHARLRKAGSPQEILRVALQFSCEYLGCEQGMLHLPDSQGAWQTVAIGLPDEQCKTLHEWRKGLLENPIFAHLQTTQLFGQKRDVLALPLDGQNWDAGWWIFVETRSPLRVSDTTRTTFAILGQSLLNAWNRALLHADIARHAEHLEQLVAQRTRELASQNAQNSAILENIAEGIVYMDLNGKVRYLNPAAHKILVQNNGETPTALGELGISSEIVQEILLHGQAGARYEREVQLPAHGRLLQITAIPSQIAPDEERGVIITLRDITQERELTILRERLVATVSHELRTPVTNIKLYLENFPKNDPELQDEFLSTLKRESLRLESLVENVLSISRLRESQLHRNRQPVCLDDLLQNLLHDRTPLAEQKGLTLNYHNHCPDVTIETDPMGLQQAINNLLENAIKYTPSGEIIITLSCQDEAIIITVADSGPGIPEEDMPYIFQRFYRGQKASMSNIPGSGLGLSITEEIVRHLGGSISAKNRPEGGAVFSICLPLHHQNFAQNNKNM